MMFENIAVGDEVSLFHTDKNRTFFDMVRYVGRAKVTAITEKTLTATGRKFLRATGAPLMPGQFNIRPADDERDAEAVRRQKERDAELKAKKETAQ